MMTEEPRTSPENLFENCHSSYVFDQVRRRLDSGESRSLWRRIESEMQSSGVGAAETYLQSSFAELIQQMRDDTAHFRESLRE